MYLYAEKRLLEAVDRVVQKCDISNLLEAGSLEASLDRQEVLLKKINLEQQGRQGSEEMAAVEHRLELLDTVQRFQAMPPHIAYLRMCVGLWLHQEAFYESIRGADGLGLYISKMVTSLMLLSCRR
jgi:hypothetical protein